MDKLQPNSEYLVEMQKKIVELVQQEIKLDIEQSASKDEFVQMFGSQKKRHETNESDGEIK